MICNNLTFDGQHCLADMGLIYVPASTKPIIAPQTVYSYMIGGRSGTMAYGDQQTAMEYQRSGVFYPAGDIADEMEAQRLWRRAAQWLGVGRRQLIMDVEPDKYIIAEVQQLDNDEYGWLDGGLKVTWLCQPYCWAVKPDQLTLQVTDRAEGSMYVNTSLPAPVDVSIVNSGDTTLTAARVIVGGKVVAFEGLTVLPGEQLEVSMMTPIGAVHTAAEGQQVSVMDKMTVFEHLTAKGAVTYSCELSFDGAGTATVTFTGHGCWR